jgi:hypothetical protein
LNAFFYLTIANQSKEYIDLNKLLIVLKMSATNETYLPNYDELYVPPLNVTAPALKAAAVHFGKYCNKQNNVIFEIFL